jgi:hypothetical protein
MSKAKKKRAPNRPIRALPRQRIAIGVEPSTDAEIVASAAEIAAAVPRQPPWVKRDPEVLNQLDALLWSAAVLWKRHYNDDEPSHREMRKSWERLDDRLAAGRLTRRGWEAHAARVYTWERHVMVGPALRRHRADQRTHQYLPEAGLRARRERAASARAAIRDLAAVMIAPGMSRASAAKRLADHPSSPEHRLAASTIRRLIRDLT